MSDSAEQNEVDELRKVLRAALDYFHIGCLPPVDTLARWGAILPGYTPPDLRATTDADGFVHPVKP